MRVGASGVSGQARAAIDRRCPNGTTALKRSLQIGDAGETTGVAAYAVSFDLFADLEVRH